VIFNPPDTCGDPELGEGCWQGRWYGRCDNPDCVGMCEFKGECLCRGCWSSACCARTVDGLPAVAMFVVDADGNPVLRPIVEGPSL